MKIKDFIKKNFRHFNAAALVDAAEAYTQHLAAGNKMMITLAGAMSTGELGITLAEMIRRDKVQAITCTGANLEEDVFNLVAHDHYIRIPHYRDLTPEQEWGLCQKGMNRVTDTCIPEDKAIRVLEDHIVRLWQRADKEGQSFFPHEFMYQLLASPALQKNYQIDPRDSWLLAACEKNLPIWVPGWEDSTLGNIFVSHVKKGNVRRFQTVRSGPEYMGSLIDWYQEQTASKKTVGFFQIGGGIAGDFPICVVPLIQQDMHRDVPCWSYFCQISDSTTSYGSYSGAVPNEKITWGKLLTDTPRFVIESDATIVAPLLFAYVLDM
jgi:deoxyhypusine synthase